MTSGSRHRFHGLWFSSAIVPFAIPLLTCVIVFLFAHPAMREARATRYWGSLVSAADSVTFIVMPVCSAVFAWDIASLHHAGFLKAPSVRPLWEVVAARGVPSLITGLACLLASWAIMLPQAATGPSLGDLVAMASTVLRIFAGLAIAVLIALVVPYWLAPPLTLIILYVWHVYPSAFPVFWVRHLAGWFPSGIPSNEQLAPRAMASSGVFALGWIVCTVVLLVSRSVLSHHGGIGVFTITACILAVLFGLGFSSADPVQERTGVLVCGSTSVDDGHSKKIRVCVWPEHRQSLNAIEKQVSYVSGKLEKVGYGTPNVVTEGMSTPNSWRFMFDMDAVDKQSIRASLVSGLHQGDDIGMSTTNNEVSYRNDIALIWLAKVAGSQRLLDNYHVADDDQHKRLSAELSSLSASSQVKWVQSAIKGYSQECGASRDNAS